MSYDSPILWKAPAARERSNEPVTDVTVNLDAALCGIAPIPQELVPRVLMYLLQRVAAVDANLIKVMHTMNFRKRKMSLDELIEYLPEHPAKQTVHSWVSEGKIPYEKNSKFLRFDADAIDRWMESGAAATDRDRMEVAEEYVANAGRQGRS